MNDFMNRGILVSVINNLDFLTSLREYGDEVLYSRGNPDEPWNLLSTSVMIKLGFEDLFEFSKKSFNIVAIFDPVKIKEVNIAWDQIPGHVNSVTEINTLSVELKEKQKSSIYTQIYIRKKLENSSRDYSFDKNGMKRGVQDVISAIGIKEISNFNGKLKNSEQKITLQNNSLRGIIITFPEQQLNWTDASPENLLKQILAHEDTKALLNKILLSKLHDLPIYFYVKGIKTTLNFTEVFLKNISDDEEKS